MLGGRGQGPVDVEQTARHWFEKTVARGGAGKPGEALRRTGVH